MYAITNEAIRIAVADIALININFLGDLVFIRPDERHRPAIAPIQFKYSNRELFLWCDGDLSYRPLTDAQKVLFWRLVIQHILFSETQ